jgi:hypothetical protein
MTSGTEAPPLERARTVEFVTRVRERFMAACERAGARGFHYHLAGQGLTLTLAGDALVPLLTPALAHLAVAAREDGLTICAWDGQSTGIAAPPPAWTSEDYYGSGAIRGLAEGGVRAAFDTWLGLLSVYDRERSVAYVWLRDARQAPITIGGTPLRVVFQWWADASDRALVHAAAVGVGGGAAIIAGASGSGKSTTALIALDRGFPYLGDDFVLVEPEPTPRVHALYGSAKIDERTLAARAPALSAAVHARERAPHEKLLLFIHQYRHHRGHASLVPTLPVAALLLPVITGRAGSRLVPAGPGEALKALVPGVLPFPGTRPAAIARLARLARRVPAFRFELGHDADGITAALHALGTAGTHP